MIGSRADINIDFTVAIVLFIFVYATLFMTLPSITLSFRQLPDPRASEAGLLSDALVRTAGAPADWTSISDATALGLAYHDVTTRPNVLDIAKLEQLETANCSDLASKLGAGDILDFKITADVNGTEYSCAGDIGTSARLIERLAYTKNGATYTPTVLRFWVW